MTLVNQDNTNTKTSTNKRTTNKKEYIVKSVFVGDRELKDVIWKIAETKTIREMGLAV